LFDVRYALISCETFGARRTLSALHLFRFDTPAFILDGKCLQRCNMPSVPGVQHRSTIKA
jgi:hypothetical protein